MVRLNGAEPILQITIRTYSMCEEEHLYSTIVLLSFCLMGKAHPMHTRLRFLRHFFFNAAGFSIDYLALSSRKAERD